MWLLSLLCASVLAIFAPMVLLVGAVVMAFLTFVHLLIIVLAHMWMPIRSLFEGDNDDR